MVGLVDKIPAEAFETAPVFIDSSEIADRLVATTSLESFEEILWLAGRLSPRSIQISRASEFLSPDEIVAGDIVRRLSRLLDEGYSIAINFVEELNVKLARHLQEIGEEFSCIAKGSLFLSPPGGATFRPHYDAIDVLAIQLVGAKIWRICSAPTELPLSKNTYPVERNIVEGMDFRLYPASMLYVPRGKVHDVKAAESYSLHLSVGLGFTSHGSVLKKCVDMSMESSIALRRTNFARQRGKRSHFYAVDDLPLPELDGYAVRIAEQSLHAAALSKQPQLPGRLRSVLEKRSLTGLTFVIRSHPCEITREYLAAGLIGIGFPGLAAGRFSQSNAFLTFPERVLPSLEYVRDAIEPFRTIDIKGSLSVDEKLILVQRLVMEGLLSLHGDRV